MARIDVPFLIVGAGPVGLIESILLANQGRESLVLERRDGPQRAPAAHVVNARSFEICRQAGLDMGAIDAVCKNPADAGHVRFVTRLAGRWRKRAPPPDATRSRARSRAAPATSPSGSTCRVKSCTPSGCTRSLARPPCRC